MPILRERARLYPKDWEAISARIKTERANGRCEFDAYGLLPGKGTQGRCTAEHGKPHPVSGAIVVLTTAHLDHDESHCTDDNLLAGCQMCHNRYDAPHRAASRKARLEQKRVLAGQVKPAVTVAAKTTLGQKKRYTGIQEAKRPSRNLDYTGHIDVSVLKGVTKEPR